MTDRRQDRFDEALRSWAKRAPHTPAPKAAREVMARLPERRGGVVLSGSRLRLATVAACLALLLVVGWFTMPTAPSGRPLPSASELALPPLSDDVVLLWLDEETPLYLTVAAPATRGGS